MIGGESPTYGLHLYRTRFGLWAVTVEKNGKRTRDEHPSLVVLLLNVARDITRRVNDVAVDQDGTVRHYAPEEFDE